MQQAAANEGRVLAEPPSFARIKAFRDHGMELELTVWIDNPGADAEVRSDLYRAILEGLAASRVEIARPRQEVRMIATLKSRIMQRINGLTNPLTFCVTYSTPRGTIAVYRSLLAPDKRLTRKSALSHVQRPDPTSLVGLRARRSSCWCRSPSPA
jgi:hypothetical protein